MDVLELGCGWGSLSLWIAEKYPHSKITAISNSHEQRLFIQMRARELGLRNLNVLTLNIGDAWDLGTFDRIVSVEMFEHVRNHETLLARIAGWLRPEGKLFVHIFCHRDRTYTFEVDGQNDWMARHFFTGGIMPSFNLLPSYGEHLAVTNQWEINGQQYAKTCEAWLANLDRQYSRVVAIFERDHKAPEAKILVQRWRMFFMACAELFAFRGGKEWFVGHYLLQPAASRPTIHLDPQQVKKIAGDL